jgi:PEP-CTERM motif
MERFASAAAAPSASARFSRGPASFVTIRTLGVLAAVLFGASAPTSASTIFDITGVGCVSNYKITDGILAAGCLGPIDQGFTLTGTVSIDVVGGPDGFSADPVGAAGNSWVVSGYQLSWTGPTSGSYVSGHIPAETDFTQHAEVYNDPAYGQELFAQIVSESQVGFTSALSSASIIRLTQSTTWLNDLTFPEAAGLAPGPPGPRAFNRISFDDVLWTSDPTTGAAVSVRPGSISGTFTLTSMTAQATPVPEPATLALVGLGMLGTRMTRRRRRG